MKKITKVLALCLALVMAMMFATSCDLNSPQSVTKMADNALNNKPYQVTMTINYSSENAQMNSAFAMINGTEFVIKADGVDFIMTNSMSIQGMSLNTSYTAIDGMIYLEQTVKSGSVKQSQKQKAEITDEQYEEFVAANNVKVVSGLSEFDEIEMEKTEDGYKLTCLGGAEGMIKDIKEGFKSSMGDADLELEVENVKLVAEVKDRKYDNMVLTFDFAIVSSGVSIIVSCELEMDYDYDVEFTVAVPEDADKYELVDYDKLGQ